MPVAYTLEVDLISPSGTIHLVARGFNLWNIKNYMSKQSPIGTDDTTSILPPSRCSQIVLETGCR